VSRPPRDSVPPRRGAVAALLPARPGPAGIALALLVAAVTALLVVRALAGDGGGPPAPRPLAEVRALAGAPRTGEGVRVDLRVTQSALPAAFARSQALPEGTTRGRLWVARADLWRLELQGEGHDWQLTREGGLLRLYGSASQTLLTLTVDRVPAGVAGIGPTRVSGPEPRVVAGRAAYRVRYAPVGRGLLVEALEVTSDAETGVPLEVALRARGGRRVLHARATGFHHEPVGADRVRVRAPRAGTTAPLGAVLALAERGAALRVEGTGWGRVLRLRGGGDGIGALLRRLSGAGDDDPAPGPVTLRLPLLTAVVGDAGVRVGAVTPERLAEVTGAG